MKPIKPILVPIAIYSALALSVQIVTAKVLFDQMFSLNALRCAFLTVAVIVSMAVYLELLRMTGKKLNGFKAACLLFGFVFLSLCPLITAISIIADAGGFAVIFLLLSLFAWQAMQPNRE